MINNLLPSDGWWHSQLYRCKCWRVAGSSWDGIKGRSDIWYLSLHYNCPPLPEKFFFSVLIQYSNWQFLVRFHSIECILDRKYEINIAFRCLPKLSSHLLTANCNVRKVKLLNLYYPGGGCCTATLGWRETSKLDKLRTVNTERPSCLSRPRTSHLLTPWLRDSVTTWRNSPR